MEKAGELSFKSEYGELSGKVAVGGDIKERGRGNRSESTEGEGDMSLGISVRLYDVLDYVQ